MIILARKGSICLARLFRSRIYRAMKHNRIATSWKPAAEEVGTDNHKQASHLICAVLNGEPRAEAVRKLQVKIN